MPNPNPKTTQTKLPLKQRRKLGAVTRTKTKYTTNRKKLFGLGAYDAPGEDYDGNEDVEDDRDILIGGRGNPIYKRQKEVIHRVNPGLATYPWANFWVNTNRYRITSFSILAILCLLVIFVLWFPAQWIPFLPSSLLTRYGAAEYLIWAGVYVINLIIAYFSDRTEFYGMGMMMNFLAWITYSLLWLVIFFSFLRCHTGELPQSCTDNYVIDGIMIVINSLLWLASLCCSFCYFIVVKQTSGTQDPIVYKLTPK